MSTKIEWTNETWNPVTGCTKISAGCSNCYAERMARRLAGKYGYHEQPDHFKVTLHPDKLNQPLWWKKPRMIFVCSMGDLFHDDVDEESIMEIIDIMTFAKQHTFQVLTKRPERMNYIVNQIERHAGGFPNNVWLGVTAENQQAADERIPLLLNTPAAVRFVSVEPMLGSVDLSLYQPIVRQHKNDFMKARGILGGKIDWVICGGETGHGSRPMKAEWAIHLRNQCLDSGVPFFFKKPGSAFTGDPSCLPTTRQYPVPQSLPEGHP
jgi:protein gp37